LLYLPGEAGHLYSALFPRARTITQSRQPKSSENLRAQRRFFGIETDKLDGWADDLKLGLEREIREMDRVIKESPPPATAR